MSYSKQHLREASEIVAKLDPTLCEKAVELLAAVRARGGRLFILGVGGSAANASHAVNDFRKLAGIESYAPTDNVSELTARTNDDGWPSVFAEWLKGSRLNGKDAILVLSVGGGSLEKNVSPNLVSALQLAKERGTCDPRDRGPRRRTYRAGCRCGHCHPDSQSRKHHAPHRGIPSCGLAFVDFASDSQNRRDEMGKHEVGRPAVFLDRDGVINRVAVRNGMPHPPSHVEEFELYDDVPDGCARLKAANFLLVVITNQPDVGRGTQSREAVEAMNLKMQSALPLLDRIEVCYHAGERYGEPCDCRKPRPGLILRAAAQLNIDPKKSYVIGDRWRDVDCARAAGCRAILIRRGYKEPLREAPDFTVANFNEAVTAVLRDAAS